TSGRGGIEPFIGMCVISAAFGLADAYVQGGMVGDLSFIRHEFSFLSGLAASGAITLGSRMATKGVFDSSQNGLQKGATRLGISKDISGTSRYIVCFRCSNGDYRITLSKTRNRQEVSGSFVVPTHPTNSSQHDIRMHDSYGSTKYTAPTRTSNDAGRDCDHMMTLSNICNSQWLICCSYTDNEQLATRHSHGS
ncbi:equilibrative nucleotide transporter 3-like protein, partial [Tanacetum coccineum]